MTNSADFLLSFQHLHMATACIQSVRQIHMTRRKVLLSCSIPNHTWTHTHYDIIEIGKAVEAVVRETLSTRDLLIVTGGQPAVLPYVLSAARATSKSNRILVYQSEYFRDHFNGTLDTLVSEGWAKVESTPAGSSLKESLKLMRCQMIKSDLLCAFFVGGMEGVEKEHDLVTQLYPPVMRFLLAEPGGATAKIAKELLISRERDDSHYMVMGGKEHRGNCMSALKLLYP